MARRALTVPKMHAAVRGHDVRSSPSMPPGMHVRGRFTGLGEVPTGSVALLPAGEDCGAAPGEREG